MLEWFEKSNEDDQTQPQHKDGEIIMEVLQSNDGNSLTLPKDLRFNHAYHRNQIVQG